MKREKNYPEGLGKAREQYVSQNIKNLPKGKSTHKNFESKTSQEGSLKNSNDKLDRLEQTILSLLERVTKLEQLNQKRQQKPWQL